MRCKAGKSAVQIFERKRAEAYGFGVDAASNCGVRAGMGPYKSQARRAAGAFPDVFSIEIFTRFQGDCGALLRIIRRIFRCVFPPHEIPNIHLQGFIRRRERRHFCLQSPLASFRMRLEFFPAPVFRKFSAPPGTHAFSGDAGRAGRKAICRARAQPAPPKGRPGRKACSGSGAENPVAEAPFRSAGRSPFPPCGRLRAQG